MEIISRGASFTVTEEGSGRAVLLIHGGSSSADDWSRVASQLVERYRVLRYDRVTYRPDGLDDESAGNALPDGGRTMARGVADVLAVVEATGERPLVVGHSSGGVVALEAARAAPEAVAGLVLYEAPGGRR